MKYQSLVRAFALLFLASPVCSHAGPSSGDRPNVVLILADDMGYGDAGSYNPQSKVPTPHLDRLAGEGMRFTNAYSPDAVCTPSRYSLLTGRYGFRHGIGFGIDFVPLGPQGRLALGAAEIEIPFPQRTLHWGDTTDD